METLFSSGTLGIFSSRKEEADAFYHSILPKISPEMERTTPGLAGLLWSKQYYHYDVERWLTTVTGSRL